MRQNLSEKAKDIIILVMSQLNMLISLVNDVLDIKMISQGEYNSKLENFNPKTTLDFIVDMF